MRDVHLVPNERAARVGEVHTRSSRTTRARVVWKI